MTLIVPGLFAVAFVAWLCAAYNGIKLLSYRKPEVSLSTLLMSGMSWFRAENFTEAGRPYQRSMMLGFGVFFLCILTLMTVVIMQVGPKY